MKKMIALVLLWVGCGSKQLPEAKWDESKWDESRWGGEPDAGPKKEK